MPSRRYHPELGLGPGPLLALGERLGLDRVHLVRSEHVGDPVGTTAQVLQREPRCVTDQRVLARLLLLRCHVSRQPSQGGGDDIRLPGRDLAAREGGLGGRRLTDPFGLVQHPVSCAAVAAQSVRDQLAG